ncbi:hypothetical protein FHW88_004558 [Mucilaginibacter sp. SG538B]|uniref:hypothetical protein n=1 Tax=Mucilaginibacter sp. SG538B TaxID=2587021 RepID=UPI00159E7C92|nr:hypothetical protein [Mucilaginibacter sp. SG538B]NVM66247.1 hypothetical protein [Mucilaginibacter sp. SG538B]
MLVLAAFACNHATKKPDKKTVKKAQKVKPKEYKEVNYTESQLIAFFDSVGKLPAEPLANKAAYYADSVFKTFTKPTNRQLSMADFKSLKQAIAAKRINISAAKRIFGEFTVDSNCNLNGLFDSVKRGYVYLQAYHFIRNKNKFDEFAVGVGDRGHCPGAMIYYFRGNKIIAKQDGYSRFESEPEYFTNVDGENIVYRQYQFAEGSGVGWFNYFFYKYDGDKLIPVLNELANGNAQGSWIGRVIWLDATVKRTNPLTIKMVYYNQFVDKDKIEFGPNIINDSTMVSYRWDEKSKTLIGQYEKSKISKAQILSYYLEDNDLLFINVFNRPLKAALNNKENRPLILSYLRNVKVDQDTVNK